MQPKMLLPVLLQLDVDYPSSLVLFCSQLQERWQQQVQQKWQQEGVLVAAKLQILPLILQQSEQFLFQQPMYLRYGMSNTFYECFVDK
jgi:hypothetical protein